MANLTWIPARVGCYWNAGEFSISTTTVLRDGKPLPFPDSGYSLMQNQNEVSVYPTLEKAQLAAEILRDWSYTELRQYLLDHGWNDCDFIIGEPIPQGVKYISFAPWPANDLASG